MKEEIKEEEVEVMSEVHVGCPPHVGSGTHISRFTFPLPSSANVLPTELPLCPSLATDEDGDLVLSRRTNTPAPAVSSQNCTLTIKHTVTSSLSSVGLQVWAAALVLADFVLHKGFNTSDFNGVIALELGAGTGLVGIALAPFAQTVFITDRGSNILDNCVKNVQLNAGLIKGRAMDIRVKELDWQDPWPPQVQTCDSPLVRLGYLWTPSDIKEAEYTSILLAADVIYSDELTDAFFSVLEKLMSRGSEKILYLALEKRYNFSLDDLDVVANGYSHFQSYFKDEDDCRKVGNGDLQRFIGKQIDLDEIPQYIREYERGNNVELWKITYCHTNCGGVSGSRSFYTDTGSGEN